MNINVNTLLKDYEPFVIPNNLYFTYKEHKSNVKVNIIYCSV